MSSFKIDLVFGSETDNFYFTPLCGKLEERGYDFSLNIFSAHRNISELKDFTSKLSGNIIIAGAGLSAALPGVLAAATQKPVIGVPLAKDTSKPYAGLDSFLSIFSMPKGIPVMTVGINAENAIFEILKLIADKKLESKCYLPSPEDNLLTIYEHFQDNVKTFGFNKKENKELWLARLTKAL